MLLNIESTNLEKTSKEEVERAHKEFLNFIWNERKQRGVTRKEWQKLAGCSPQTIPACMRGEQKTPGLLYVMQLLDALDLKLVIEDKDSYWGENEMRIRVMPKRLYIGERIEARERIRAEGFQPRVDLFESPDIVKKFIPTPCDVYEIRTGRLNRQKFELMEHPFGNLYSYQNIVSPECILGMTTYR